ncbi:MAG: transposase [Verrucomicrobiota bacterium]
MRYFVTCCTQKRRGSLTAIETSMLIRSAAVASDALGDTETYAFTVMPDHVHWLFQLGGRLSLGRLVARFKVQTGPVLDIGRLAWQRDFYEHRLRAEESSEAYGRYIFLNPYRAGLLHDATWPGWFCARPEIFGFLALLNEDGSPPRAWIGEAIPQGLAIGE